MGPLATCEIDQAVVSLFLQRGGNTYLLWYELLYPLYPVQLQLPCGGRQTVPVQISVVEIPAGMPVELAGFCDGVTQFRGPGAKSTSRITRRPVTFQSMNQINQSSWKLHWILREVAGPCTKHSEMTASFHGRRLSITGGVPFYFLSTFSVCCLCWDHHGRYPEGGTLVKDKK